VHRTDALDVVKESIAQVIPDADLVTLGPDDTFRDALEMDSLDFRSFIETLSERTGRPHRRRMHPLPHHALR
jgi:acyl carrier protein